MVGDTEWGISGLVNPVGQGGRWQESSETTGQGEARTRKLGRGEGPEQEGLAVNFVINQVKYKQVNFILKIF